VNDTKNTLGVKNKPPKLSNISAENAHPLNGGNINRYNAISTNDTITGIPPIILPPTEKPAVAPIIAPKPPALVSVDTNICKKGGTCPYIVKYFEKYDSVNPIITEITVSVRRSREMGYVCFFGKFIYAEAAVVILGNLSKIIWK
jgi:hypothetical protein